MLAFLEGFIDASEVLDGRSEADFYDVGQVGALTRPVIGEAIAALMLTRLDAGGGAAAERPGGPVGPEGGR